MPHGTKDEIPNSFFLKTYLRSHSNEFYEYDYGPPGIAFVNGTNSLGETPLFLACKLGNLEVAKAFVEWGAEPDARDKEVRNTRTYGGIVVLSCCLIVVLF